MRQIKFRVWDSILKEMIAHEQLLEDQRCGPLTYGELVTVEECDSVLMQFTGLRDKNGKDVYEGDIVKWGHNVDTIGSSMGMCFDGGFEEGVGEISITPLGVFVGEEGKSLWGMLDHMEADIDSNIEEFEVIGNIHENPELLEAP